MTDILRTPTKIAGELTTEEKTQMKDHANLWITRALRTDPIEPKKIIPAIEGIYEAAELSKPQVVIASSPLAMAYEYGAASAILGGALRSTAARDTFEAIVNTTIEATENAAHETTASATFNRTLRTVALAIYNATHDTTHIAINSDIRNAPWGLVSETATMCRESADPIGLENAKQWWEVYQGGNMWAPHSSYLTALSDVLGLRLPEYDVYAHWEQAAIHGGFRVLHPKFCVVSDFPEFIHMDENHKPHCETGPSHRWRDGWSLYHWHGGRVPAHWIEDRENLDPDEVMRCENVAQRLAGYKILGRAEK